MHSAATRRRGRKRKKLYYRGVKIKVPRGFFSKWTTVQRGNWTTQTKKDYQLPPYNVHEDDDAKERHDARREREGEQVKFSWLREAEEDVACCS